MFMSAALTRVDLSVAYPVMSGLVFILVLGVSSVFFAEQITLMRLIGVFLILSGVLAIAGSNRRQAAGHRRQEGQDQGRLW
jgi:multidrug transporter EmrE-like cation transporter